VDRATTLLITGSTGIAAATARLAAARGMNLFVVSRTEANARALGTELRCGWLAGDLADPLTAEAAVGACVERHGRLDAVFNVAGISGRAHGDGPVHEATEQGWDATLDANAKSMFLTCRAAVKLMLAQAPDADGMRGSILNMSSVLATRPEPAHFGTHAYAASKGAILSMSRAMAATYAPRRIRVNVIAPALVRTPMSKRAQENPDIVSAMRARQPLTGGFIEPEAVAKAALFLLGSDSAAVTGDVLTVDGGWSVT
jgi:NAD(P)-dependent dehydrogenase (short-subunit alcohol dehydrogenase family)